MNLQESSYLTGLWAAAKQVCLLITMAWVTTKKDLGIQRSGGHGQKSWEHNTHHLSQVYLLGRLQLLLLCFYIWATLYLQRTLGLYQRKEGGEGGCDTREGQIIWRRQRLSDLSSPRFQAWASLGWSATIRSKEEAMEGSPSKLPQGKNPTGRISSEFWSPKLWKNMFL